MTQKDIYYHGTDNFLPTGTVMTGRGSAYAEDWKTLGEAYDILEERRPQHLIAHRNAVFMCSVDVDNPPDTGLDNIGICGGGTKYVSILRPKAPVSRHDINQMSLAQHLIGEEADIKEIYAAVDDYWAGVASGDPLWEFLTTEAVVFKTEVFQTYDPENEDDDIVYLSSKDMAQLELHDPTISKRLKYINSSYDNQMYLGIMKNDQLVSCLILEALGSVENGDRRLVMQGISTDADYQMQGMARKLVEHASKLALASEMPLVPSRYSHDGELYIRPIMDALTHKKAMTGNENHLAQGL